MKKEYTLTVSSKGQVTLPVELRRSFGVDEKGSTLKLVLDDEARVAQFERLMSFEEIQALAQKYMKPGIEPLADAHTFYETRKPRL